MSALVLLSILQASNGQSEHSENSLAPRLTSNVLLDIDPLPDVQRRGLIAVTVMAFLSFIATGTLLAFITFRLIFWRGSYTRYIGYNQYIILIYNLVLADFQQSLAFLICLQWIVTNKIKSGTAGCFLQGLWLQIGDPGSGLFVLAIAIHTFLLVVWGRKMSYKVFVGFVCGVWVFIAIIVIAPLARYGADVFVPAGAWCWINEDYEAMRLWTHYIWIFFAEFGTVCLYAVMYFQLRRQIASSSILGNSQLESLKRLRRVVGYMTIYPIVYIILSLPLAAGRMATANGHNPSLTFFCCAGAIITSSGLVDVILYTLTRRNLIIDSEPSHDRSYNKFASSKGRRGDTHLTTITAEPKSKKLGLADTTIHERDGSTDNIVQAGVEMNDLGKVYQETTIEITTEPAYVSEESSERSSKDDEFSDATPNRMWRR
ncbi:Glucose receptor Git3 N-terminal [Penicillium malachiteum]|uniref:Glucose receptor Git3 N-terminal n=1 Tax=Penicillium malachiteum TaxID=1324776 RepID=UPI002546FC48|nr:Glucose receptor Git3 N-terminal [Penicillium malachiteum]KAJ5729233.1 Glucose receptor Git3 N-terminal [Penicillium malachiteum]